MKRITIIGIIFLTLNSLTAQNSEEFKINSENSPSTIKQYHPALFYTNDGFVVEWKDERDGELKYYAQKFDSLGNKIGGNFQIRDNNKLFFLKNGSFLALNEVFEWQSWLSDESKFISMAGFYSNNSEILTDSFIDQSDWDIYHYYFSNIAETNNEYLYILNIDGEVKVRKFDEFGNLSFESHESLFPIAPDFGEITKMTVTKRSDGNFSLIYTNQNYWENKDGYYFSIINNNNNGELVSAEKKIIFNETSIDTNINYYSENKLLDSRTLNNDNTLLVFNPGHSDNYNFANYFSYVILNETGDTTQGVVYKKLIEDYADSLKGIFDLQFKFINEYENNFPLYISFTVEAEHPPYERTYYEIIHFFDKDGNLLEDKSIIYSTKEFRTDVNIYAKNDGNYFKPISENNDIYLAELQNFEIINKTILNDDTIGSNEQDPVISVIDENKCFVSWKNENKIVGREFDLLGNVDTNDRYPESQNIFFFDDGIKYTTWNLMNDSLYKDLGFTIYNNDWGIISNIKISTRSVYESMSIGSTIISQDYVFLIVKDYNVEKIMKYTKEGILVDELILDDNKLPQLMLLKENENSFWMFNYYEAILYDQSFNMLKTITKDKKFTYNFSNYLGEEKLLLFSLQLGWETGKIYSMSGELLLEKPLVPYASEMVTQVYNNQYIIMAFKRGNDFYYKIFDYNLDPLTHEEKINSDSTTSKKQIRLQAVDNKIIFVWSEAKEKGSGYDIIAKIIDISGITNIDEENKIDYSFFLSQNYPNPFNPSTIINYTLAEAGKTKIIVYDILGREVETLVNQFQPAGNYKLNFYADNLSSGIYFYRIITSNFTQTKKMILMK